jgi:hypothetical protein
MGRTRSTDKGDEKYRLRREDNIKMDLKEIGFEDVDCIHLAWNTDFREHV